jgi:hypothetical protein
MYNPDCIYSDATIYVGEGNMLDVFYKNLFEGLDEFRVFEEMLSTTMHMHALCCM